jgi:hypothetical protein
MAEMKWDYRIEDRAPLFWLQTLAFRNGWNLDKLAWFKVDRGRSDTCLSGVWGRCRYPNKKIKFFRISCHVRGPGRDPSIWKPFRVLIRHQPIYRNEDGTWPPMPIDRTNVQVRERNGRVWKATTSRLLLMTEAEAVVWIGAHEFFHFLRKTRQIPGRNVEWQADDFANKILQEYRDGTA